jgi:hypothetical protein
MSRTSVDWRGCLCRDLEYADPLASVQESLLGSTRHSDSGTCELCALLCTVAPQGRPCYLTLLHRGLGSDPVSQAKVTEVLAGATVPGPAPNGDWQELSRMRGRGTFVCALALDEGAFGTPTRAKLMPSPVMRSFVREAAVRALPLDDLASRAELVNLAVKEFLERPDSTGPVK